MRFSPDWLLPGGSRTAYERLISSTGGEGPQSNKWGYVLVVQWGTICATIQTLAGGIGFAFKPMGDAASWGVYWGANNLLWGALFAAVAVTKIKQATATKELKLAAMPQAVEAPEEPDAQAPSVTTETSVTASKTTTKKK